MDTIKTLIAFRDFTIINPERFGGVGQVKRFEKANLYGNASMTCPVIITPKEKEQGYFPRIALVCNPFNINQSFTNVSIEFSIPKLLFNNNIEEVKKLDSEDEGTEMMIHADYTNATNSAPSSINTTALIESNSKYKRKRNRHSRRLTNAIIAS